jgi:hypothetical protein
MNRAQRGKLALAAAALGLGLLTMTGCGYITPQQTTQQYSASDGIRADLGPLELRNMLIVSAGEDKPGRLLGAVYNSSSKDVKLTVNGAKGSQTQVSVKANSYTLLNDSTDEAILSTSGGAAGSLVDIKVREDGTNVDKTIKVPVLDATLKEYQKYLPEGSQTTGTASSTPSQFSSASGTASPTPSPSASTAAASH